MTNTQRVAILGVTAAITAALITFGVLGGEQASAIQTVAVAVVTLVAAFLIKPSA
jgi:hypothetical protein